MMCLEQTLLSVRHQTYMMAHSSVLTWLYRMLSVTLSVVQHGYLSNNGGGVGWGEVINGGFGMVIDGSEDSDRHIRQMLLWDVNNGIARRSWARNTGSIDAIRREMERTPGLCVTLPNIVEDDVINTAF